MRLEIVLKTKAKLKQLLPPSQKKKTNNEQPCPVTVMYQALSQESE